ncbi:MAG: Ax21 family protein, partial [Stenotrophomonas sp.]
MKTSLIALALAAALPFGASAAEGLSYNYAEGDYVKTDADGGKADGWGVKGSYGFLPNFHAFGEYNQQKTDIGNFKVDQWRVGVGYNHEIATSTD